jgi:hypothetical protein
MAGSLSGTVYVGGVGAELQPVSAITSLLTMRLQKGDAWNILTPTKGFEGRQKHVNNFLESDHDFIFFADADQHFPHDTLEKLRAHGLPFVAGFYPQRMFPINPVWRAVWDEWPARWYTNPIDPEGGLVEIGSAGWGCTLVHRSVFEAMAPILKGEPFIVEDDMDVWPYDLEAVLRGEESLRPLRGVKTDSVGSDIRFAWYARHAGFKLYGDPSAACGHYISYALGWQDYEQPVNQENLRQYFAAQEELRQQIAENRRELLEHLENARRGITFEDVVDAEVAYGA